MFLNWNSSNHKSYTLIHNILIWTKYKLKSRKTLIGTLAEMFDNLREIMLVCLTQNIMLKFQVRRDHTMPVKWSEYVQHGSYLYNCRNHKGKELWNMIKTNG